MEPSGGALSRTRARPPSHSPLAPGERFVPHKPMETATRFRWWPGLTILGLGATAFLGVYYIERVFPSVWPYEQSRNMVLIILTLVVILLLVLWWFLFSRLGIGARLLGLAVVLLPMPLFRYAGMSGDFVPIFEFRWKKAREHVINPFSDAERPRPDFPQFLGPTRDGRLSGPVLDPDWTKNPPQIVWRKSVGAAWSGFAVVGGRAVTQEEIDEQEFVVCCELNTGKELWRVANPDHYSSGLAGTGPRATPTIVDGRVYTLGSTGIVRCTTLADGKVQWTRDLRADAGVKVPEWGFSSSPLVHEGKVIVSAGGKPGKSLIAYRAGDGEIAWSAGDGEINYSSPFLRTVAGRPQILMLNGQSLSSHDPATGALLWEYAWPSGRPNVAQPLAIGGNRVFISSGYAWGSELAEVTADANGRFQVDRIWKSPRFQAKFSNPVERDGHVYGVSDGDFACLDLRDGSRKWKGAHYGHGQNLLVGEYFLQVAEEKGDLVLLRPTPEAANELAKFNVFDAKTWNPLALCDDLLLMRNDREAACLRLPVKR
jgi:outer membrane protein assembly factor BamB